MNNNEIIKFLQSKQIPQCGDKEYTADEEYEAYQRAIDAVEQTTWIPFSERLPKSFERCLITTTDGEVIYHYDDGQYSKYKAWMPLPPSYKGE